MRLIVRRSIRAGRPVAIRWLIDHSQAFAHATRWLRSRNDVQPVVRTPVPRVSQQEYIDNFNAIVRLAKDHGAAVIVIGAPYRDSVTNPPEAQLMTQYRAWLEIGDATEPNAISRDIGIDRGGRHGQPGLFW